MSKDNAYLFDILSAARAIQRFIAGVSREQFLANEEKSEAVCRKFEIIGEAARRLSEETKGKFPEIPWRVGNGAAGFAAAHRTRGRVSGGASAGIQLKKPCARQVC